MAAHSGLTGADLHEPKAVAGASANQVYLSDGAGSGSWTAANAIDTQDIGYKIADITTADSYWVPIPWACTLTGAHAALGPGSGGLNTDTTITFEIGGVATTGGVITLIASGSAEGDQSVATAITGNNVFDGLTAIEIVNDGAASVGAEVELVLEFTLT